MRFIRNKIRQLFKRRQVDVGSVTAQQAIFQKELSHNPYLQSKALWNDMYGDLEKRYRNNQLVIIILTVVIAFAIVGLIMIAGQIKVKSVPFVIHGNDLITMTDQSSGEFQSLQPKMAIYFAKQFIRDTRSVSVDRSVNASQQVSAYSVVTGSAIQMLKDFYEKNNPNDLAINHAKDVEITSVLSGSTHVINIRWRENTRDMHSGEIIKTEQFIAELDYQYTEPSQNETILKHNPLGFYITYFSWGIDQNS